jgi:phospholipid transport system substrate-binding protein
MLLTRRHLLAFTAATAAYLSAGTWLPAASAQDAGAETRFVEQFGNKLVAVVNGDEPLATKQQMLRPLIDSAVDVDAIARFSLGRFVNSATPQQLSEYSRLFHGVLVNNITSKLGDFRGVTFRMTTSTMRGPDAYVGTVVTRPNNAPNNVQWVVSDSSGSPRIVDVVAEGTSLRLTQRNDYASFLSHNNNNVDALIAAMRRQIS